MEKISVTLLPFQTEVGTKSIFNKPVVYTIIEKPPYEYLPITTARGEAYTRHENKILRMKYPTLQELAEPPESEIPTLPRKIVFVAMSFKEEEEPALVDYYNAMERAATETRLPITLHRIDRQEGDYEISQKIMDEIDQSDIVITDFTLSPRNVYFELGYTRGKGIRVIQTARNGTELEFDVRNWRIVFYRNATELESKLIPALMSAYDDVRR